MDFGESVSWAINKMKVLGSYWCSEDADEE